MAKKSAPSMLCFNIQKKEKYIIPRKKRRRAKGNKRSGKRNKRERLRTPLFLTPSLFLLRSQFPPISSYYIYFTFIAGPDICHFWSAIASFRPVKIKPKSAKFTRK